MLKNIWTSLCNAYVSIGLKYGFVKDNLEEADFKVTDLKLYPPSPATILDGESINAEVSYTSNIKGKRIQIWVLNNTDDLKSFYQGSGIESANGSVTRGFEIAEVGHLDSIAVLVNYIDGREIARVTYPVDYTIVENPEKEALKSDGMGARVEIINVMSNDTKLEPNSKIPVGQWVDVAIKYQHDAQHETRSWAMPVTNMALEGGYDSGEMPPDDKSGTIVKSFLISSEGKTDGIHVHMVNVADETIAEQFLDFPIEYVK